MAIGKLAEEPVARIVQRVKFLRLAHAPPCRLAGRSKTSDIAGDGTTTATVLAHAIVREGAKAVAAGMNPEA